MKTKLVTFFLLSAAFVAAGARAQTVQATTPAPAVPTVTPAAPALAPSAPLAPNQLVYTHRLPGVNELTNIAAAQGLTIERIEQSASQVTVVYKYANGQTNTVAYLPLPGSAGSSPQLVVSTTPPPVVVVSEPAPRVVYYDGYGPGYYYSSNPEYWYPPVSIALGFGFRGGGYHGGGFRGGFHHGR